LRSQPSLYSSRDVVEFGNASRASRVQHQQGTEMTKGAAQDADTEQTPQGLSKAVTTECLAIGFRNLRRQQDKVIGNVDVRWYVPLNERRIVLIDQDFVFSVRSRRRIFERTMIVMSTAMHLQADVYVDPDSSSVSLEVCADWLGTSIVERRCETY
jgi:hypothetical protein